VKRRAGVVGLRVDELESERRGEVLEQRKAVPECHGLEHEPVLVNQSEPGERLGERGAAAGDHLIARLALIGPRMTHDLRFQRMIDARPEEVFDAFTRPDGQRAFYGQDDPGWIVRSECDLRVGGVWTVAFGPSPSQLYRHEHVFEAIERPRRLVLTTTETRLDGSSFKTELEFTFEDHGPS
jgi:uncharacterized protein YndB with AHSA1/START domain